MLLFFVRSWCAEINCEGQESLHRGSLVNSLMPPPIRLATSPACLGARFSSTRSFNNRDPFRNTGEEFVHRLEVFLLQIREVSQDLILGHSGCQVRCEVVDREAQAANAGLATHFARFDCNAWV